MYNTDSLWWFFSKDEASNFNADIAEVELQLKWTNYCVLSVAGRDNNYAYSSNIIFTVENTTLHVPVVTLSARQSKTVKTS